MICQVIRALFVDRYNEIALMKRIIYFLFGKGAILNLVDKVAAAEVDLALSVLVL